LKLGTDVCPENERPSAKTEGLSFFYARKPGTGTEKRRSNGAKSKGPKTAAGKEKSKRNAIKHGERADALKFLVPPHSACLLHEERLAFYNLFDRNIAKYRATDDHEKEIVHEITSLQWASGRSRVAFNALLNREILRTGATLQPLDEQTFNVENIVAAYEGLAGSRVPGQFQKEYVANTRLIIALERRLAHVQKIWPGQSKTAVNSNEERRQFGVPEAPEAPPEEKPSEGTQPEAPQPVENTQNAPKKRKKVVNVTAPLTPEKIRLYKQVFPNRDLEFNVYEPEPKAA
jgi:hypothetical protein